MLLEHVTLFSNLNQEDIAQLETIDQERSVAKNTMVINKGDDTGCLYIILKGKAHALRSDESGRQFIVNRFDF